VKLLDQPIASAFPVMVLKESEIYFCDPSKI